MPRKDLSLLEKIAILDQINTQPPKTTHRQLAKITKVPKSTIARLLQQQEKLREEWTFHCDLQRTSHKRKREGKYPDIEHALIQWFSIMTQEGMHVNGPMLKSKSEEFAKELGHMNFKATDSWLSRWKYRHNITYKKAYSEKTGADDARITVNSLQRINKCDLLKHLDMDCTENEMALLQCVKNCDEILEASNNLQCHDENEDYREMITEQIVKKQLETSEHQENNDDIPEQVTNLDAMKCIAKLRCYFMQKGNESSPLSALDTCAHFVQLQSMERTHQDTKEENSLIQMGLNQTQNGFEQIIIKKEPDWNYEDEDDTKREFNFEFEVNSRDIKVKCEKYNEITVEEDSKLIELKERRESTALVNKISARQ